MRIDSQGSLATEATQAMLPADRLILAIDIQSRSYKLFRWLGEAINRGFIPAARAHEYASAADATLDWIEQHYLNIPEPARPDRRWLKEFAQFFATYLTTSFDILEQPRKIAMSRCGCYCWHCTYLANAPHLKPKKVSKRDKAEAAVLMVDRVLELAQEEGVATDWELATGIVQNVETRRAAGYSAYGYWMIRRLEGLSPGTPGLALWREIAWTKAGSPIQKFKVEFKDFVKAEELLGDALQAAPDRNETDTKKSPE